MFIQLLDIKTFARQKNEVSKFLSHFSLYPTVIFNIQLAEENSLQASFFFLRITLVSNISLPSYDF